MKVFQLGFIAISLSFITSCGIDDTTKDDTNSEAKMTDEIILGGKAWADWWRQDAGGSGNRPKDSSETLDTGDHKNKYRCKSCHGWDLKGTSGGYSDHLKGEANKRVVSFDLANKTIDSEDISKSNGRVTLDAMNWDEHDSKAMPDYTSSETEDNKLSSKQITALTAFINEGPKLNTYAKITKGENGKSNPSYEFINANLEEGAKLYKSGCESCHGGDGKLIEELALGTYFRKAGKYSEGFHKILYGNPGTSMTREVQGSLNGAQAKDVLAYIQSNDKVFID